MSKERPKEKEKVTSGTISTLNDLKLESIALICRYLSLKELGTLGVCNRKLHDVVQTIRLLLKNESTKKYENPSFLFTFTLKEFHIQWDAAEKQTIATNASVDYFNKGKFQRAIKQLVKEGVMDGSAKSVAGFLHEERKLKRLTRKALGKFILGQNNKDILLEFVGKVDFKGLEMTEGLRKFFALIKIPGTQQHHTLKEARKEITSLPVVQNNGTVVVESALPFSLVMECFGSIFFQQNPSTLFQSAKSVSNLAYITVSHFYGEKLTRKQTPAPLTKFIENCKGINNGQDLPASYLENIYDRGLHIPIFGTKSKFVPIHKTGWLFKKGTEMFTFTKKRWFLLKGSSLMYFSKPGEFEVEGIIYLENVEIDRDKKSFKLKTRDAFLKEASTKSRSARTSLFLSADTDEECESWVNTLKSNSYVTQPAQTSTTSTTVFSAPATPITTPNSSNPSTPQGKEGGSFITPAPGVLSGVGNVFKKIGNSRSLTKLPKMPEGLQTASGTSAPPASSKDRQEIPYFGVSIEKIVEREGTQVPLLVTKCIEYLVRDLDEVGILRLSGSLSEINDVKDKINHGDLELKTKDPHVVAGIFKSFFRDLPDPLFSKQFNDGLSTILAFAEGGDVMEECRNIIYSLPKSKMLTLRALVEFFIKIVAHSDHNKMDLANVMRVMTPTLNCIPGFITMPMQNFDYFFGEEAAASVASAQQSQHSHRISKRPQTDIRFNETHHDPHSRHTMTGAAPILPTPATLAVPQSTNTPHSTTGGNSTNNPSPVPHGSPQSKDAKLKDDRRSVSTPHLPNFITDANKSLRRSARKSIDDSEESPNEDDE